MPTIKVIRENKAANAYKVKWKYPSPDWVSALTSSLPASWEALRNEDCPSARTHDQFLDRITKG
jgi:hypothetical protein